MQDRAETATTGSDEIAKAKAEVKQEINKAREPSKPAAEVSAAEKLLAQKLLQELSEKAIAAREVRDVDKATGGLSIETKRKEAIAVKVALVKVLEAVKEGIITPPAKTKVILSELAERAGRLTDTSASYLQPLLEKYIGRELTFSKADQEPTQFEKDFRQLNKDNPNAAQLLGQILIDNVGELGDITKDDLSKQLGLNLDEEGKVILSEEEKREVGRRAQRRMEEEEVEAGVGPREELRMLLEQYPQKDHKLINALFEPREFENFVQTEYYDKIRKEFEDKGYSGDRLEEEIGKELSERLRQDIALLVGKLYQKVDESHPAEFWEEVEKRGGFWRNAEVFSENLLRQIGNLRNAEFTEGFRSKIKFFIKEQETYKEIVPAIPRFDKKAIREDTRLFVKPLRFDRSVDISTFLLSIETLARSHEIQTRKFLHNGRALIYNPVDPEKGYYSSLSGYADKLLPATSVDVLFTLPDAEEIMAASQLEDKLFEADFANFNWIHQPGSAGLDQLGMTKLDKESLDYLMMINPKLKEDAWRAKRALIMGIGDNYTISLRHLENGAYADPSLNPEEGMGPTYGSYGPRDSIPYMAFNMLAHDNMRWQAERLWLGNLLFLPVRGKDLAGRFGFMKFWDHRTLMDEMKKSIDSYIKGRSPEDVEKGVVRWIDIINPGRVGSIYSRGGWREFYAYESHLVRATEAELKQGIRFNITESWKALENVGIECLKDFVGRIGTLDSSFYEGATKDNRRLLVEHIYKKYFSSGATSGEIDKKFKQLEENENVGQVYKKFFYQALARAMKQRMPTKFVRIERNRSVSGRARGWQEVRNKSGLSDLDFERAIKDICAAEVYLRKETSKILKDQYKAGKKLNEIKDVGYNLTEEKLRSYLNQDLGITDSDRLEKAMKVFKTIDKFADEKYLDEFAKKYAADPHEHGFPFAIAVEELDRSLLAHRAAGERTIARALGDTSMVEMQVAKTISNFFKTIQNAAVDGKKDFHEIVNSIDTVKSTIEMIIGKDAGHRMAHHMAALTISYFKKDTVSDNIFTRGFVVGKPHSLAAEFAGTWRGVWEWQPDEIFTFCNELEKRNILPKEPYEKHKAPEWEKEPLAEFNFLGQKVRIGGKRKPPDYAFYGKTLREEFGGTWKHLFNHILNKYLPLFALFILIQYLRKAYSESTGQKG